ncbi:hypothetical protein H4219_006146 [Mycoemilia scoparia]|uniref:Uncharacterized protein n=1 Tax=Mycoemilia scoparia TaxID=417184 RepID=A0A9W8DMU9_9FUNG|nr:hypothetical protein H4219_006146 [Mycoemilia scoparia]
MPHDRSIGGTTSSSSQSPKALNVLRPTSRMQHFTASSQSKPQAKYPNISVNVNSRDLGLDSMSTVSASSTRHGGNVRVPGGRTTNPTTPKTAAPRVASMSVTSNTSVPSRRGVNSNYTTNESSHSAGMAQMRATASTTTSTPRATNIQRLRDDSIGNRARGGHHSNTNSPISNAPTTAPLRHTSSSYSIASPHHNNVSGNGGFYKHQALASSNNSLASGSRSYPNNVKPVQTTTASSYHSNNSGEARFRDTPGSKNSRPATPTTSSASTFKTSPPIAASSHDSITALTGVMSSIQHHQPHAFAMSPFYDGGVGGNNSDCHQMMSPGSPRLGPRSSHHSNGSFHQHSQSRGSFANISESRRSYHEAMPTATPTVSEGTAVATAGYPHRASIHNPMFNSSNPPSPALATSPSSNSVISEFPGSILLPGIAVGSSTNTIPFDTIAESPPPSLNRTTAATSSSTAIPENMVVNVSRGGARILGPPAANRNRNPATSPTLTNTTTGSAASFVSGNSTSHNEPHLDHRNRNSNNDVENGVVDDDDDDDDGGGDLDSNVSNIINNNNKNKGTSNINAKTPTTTGRSRNNSVFQTTEESMEAAEARVSRKMQDLEISNKSLLAVNSQLENKIKKQKVQITELKDMLRRQVSLGGGSPGGSVGTSLLALGGGGDDDDNEREKNVERNNDNEAGGIMDAVAIAKVYEKEDRAFRRMIASLEMLIKEAKEAIEYRSIVSGGKVITTSSDDVVELLDDDAAGGSESVSGVNMTTATTRRSSSSSSSAGSGNNADGDSNTNENDHDIPQNSNTIPSSDKRIDVDKTKELVTRLVATLSSSSSSSSSSSADNNNNIISSNFEQPSGQLTATATPLPGELGNRKDNLRKILDNSNSNRKNKEIADICRELQSLLV